MKRIVGIFLVLLLLLGNVCPCAYAIQETPKKVATVKTYANAPKIEIAFVFDSNAEKTNQVVTQYKPIITKSLAPDYRAIFANDLIFKGNWDEQSSINAAKRALNSRAKMIVCFGYWSGEYLKKYNKTKNVITVDEFAIRGFSDKFFNPVQQSVNDFVVFKNLVPNMGKTAILMNERVYKSKSNWDEVAKKGFKEKNCDIDFVIIPVTGNVLESVNKIPDDVGSVYVTQIYNLTSEQRKEMYRLLAERKLPTFSSMGREDVVLGAMLGTSTKDLDKKLAEQISFSIKDVIKGKKVKNVPLKFVDDNVLFFNKDTADIVGYNPHIRLLKSVEVISEKKPELHDLSYVFKTMEERNLSIQRKRFLISAAKRSLASAYLHYLPTTRIDLGYQNYNAGYAYSYDNVPKSATSFTFGIDQVLYSPDLVTNIIVKHKSLNFNKAEKVLTEQNVGLELAQIYIQYQMLKNQINFQKRYVDDLKTALAMAKNRKVSGKCGNEEVLRFAGEVSNAERDLLLSTAEFENVKTHMNQLLYTNQTLDFDLAPITTRDPAFFMSDINLLDYVRTPDKMAKFTTMVAEEAMYVSPETTKLKAAIAMKKAEMANYAQKFVLPSAKLSYEWGNMLGRDLPYYDYLAGNIPGYPGMKQLRAGLGDGNTDVLERNSQRLLIVAQWKPIEGGTKIAEMARCKSELNELKAYLEQVNTQIEYDIRAIINRAISKYLCIERSYRYMQAEEENLQLVKEKYIAGRVTAPQMLDAVRTVKKARVDAANSQYEFFNELVWLQRGLASVNWSNATPEAKNFIKKLKQELVPENDINVNL